MALILHVQFASRQPPHRYRVQRRQLSKSCVRNTTNLRPTAKGLPAPIQPSCCSALHPCNTTCPRVHNLAVRTAPCCCCCCCYRCAVLHSDRCLVCWRLAQLLGSAGRRCWEVRQLQAALSHTGPHTLPLTHTFALTHIVFTGARVAAL